MPSKAWLRAHTKGYREGLGRPLTLSEAARRAAAASAEARKHGAYWPNVLEATELGPATGPMIAECANMTAPQELKLVQAAIYRLVAKGLLVRVKAGWFDRPERHPKGSVPCAERVRRAMTGRPRDLDTIARLADAAPRWVRTLIWRFIREGEDVRVTHRRKGGRVGGAFPSLYSIGPAPRRVHRKRPAEPPSDLVPKGTDDHQDCKNPWCPHAFRPSERHPHKKFCSPACANRYFVRTYMAQKRSRVA